MLSGLPWWTTDVGGFSGGDITDPVMRELVVRWYQYGALCPIMRTHGDRDPKPMAPLPPTGKYFGEPGAYCTAPHGVAAGAPNEVSFKSSFLGGRGAFHFRFLYMFLFSDLRAFIQRSTVGPPL